MFENISAYPDDAALLTRLGLVPFKGLPACTEHFIGSVQVDQSGKVALYVTGFPAQFWRAVITNLETQQAIELSTGSGPLVDYWPTFKLFATGMVVVDKFTVLG